MMLLTAGSLNHSSKYNRTGYFNFANHFVFLIFYPFLSALQHLWIFSFFTYKVSMTEETITDKYKCNSGISSLS